jgi:hypothetical protein
MKDDIEILNDYQTSLENNLISLLQSRASIESSILNLNEQLASKQSTLEANEKHQAEIHSKLAAVKHLKTEFHFNKRSQSPYLSKLNLESTYPLQQFKTLTSADIRSLTASFSGLGTLPISSAMENYFV